MSEVKESLKCSFCGKSQEMVKKMVAGPGVHICNECIDLCQEIVEDELNPQEQQPSQAIPYMVRPEMYHVYIPPISPSEFQEEITVSVTIKKSSK